MSGDDQPKHLGRYQIVREIGKGAMGVVYEGRDPHLNRRVAIKTARRDVLEASEMAEEMMERFVREASATGALNHPNIITIYDAGQSDDTWYIAMEYLEKGDLRDVLNGRRKLAPAEIAETGALICDALFEAHAAGVVHRDIKPANIMTPPGKPLKVADFGIAWVTDSELTQDGALVGTPHYMSPEQFMGYKLDGRSDLFSVGVMLYELLTGNRPFEGEALTTVMHQVMKTVPVEPAKRNHEVPEPLSLVVMKAISKRPQDRYEDGHAMAAALRESLRPEPNAVVLGFELAEEDTAPLAGPAFASGPQSVYEDTSNTPTVVSRGVSAPPPVFELEVAEVGNRGWIWLVAGVGALILVVVVGTALARWAMAG